MIVESMTVLILLLFIGFIRAEEKDSALPVDKYLDPAEAERRHLPLCSPDNLKLDNVTTGDFYLLPDGSFEYQFSHCRLRKFTVREAFRCLKGTNILFMGDSLTRYFYLSLASFFSRGHWSPRFSKHTNERFPRLITVEQDFKRWDIFLQDTNRALQTQHSYEFCDCYRNISSKFYENSIYAAAHSTYENRHFRYAPNLDVDNGNNDVRLNFIQWFGQMPMRGHKFISHHIPRNNSGFQEFAKEMTNKLCPNLTAMPMTIECQAFVGRQRELRLNPPWDFPHFVKLNELCKGFPNIDETTSLCFGFEREIMRPMGVTHLIMNIGWHSGLQHFSYDFIDKTVAAAKLFLVEPPSNPKLVLPKVIWRSATAGAVFELGEPIAVNRSVEISNYKMFTIFAVRDMTKVLLDIERALDSKNDAALKKLIKLSFQLKKHPFAEQLEFSKFIPHIFVDPAHYVPWVYNEINNVFLNAICRPK